MNLQMRKNESARFKLLMQLFIVLDFIISLNTQLKLIAVNKLRKV